MVLEVQHQFNVLLSLCISDGGGHDRDEGISKILVSKRTAY